MKQYNVPAVEKALLMMELLAGSELPLRITEISTELNISKTTVVMTLSTLERHGYVARNGDGKYKFTSKLINLGANGSNYKDIARKHLEVLASELRYTAHLTVFKDGENALLDKVSGPGYIQFQTYLGKLQPFHATSSGKAILASLGDDERSQLLVAHPLTSFTQNTITSTERLLIELATIRKLGFSLEDQEEELGVRCVGAPVFNASGDVIGAVSVTAAVAELDLKDAFRVGERVKATAERISRELGADMLKEGSG